MFQVSMKLIVALTLLWGADEQAGTAPAAPAANAQKYTLAFKFSDQQKWHYTQHQDSEFESSYDGSSEKVINRSDVKKHLNIVKVLPDGSAELELIIDSVVMHAQVGDNLPEDFDSNSKEEADRPDFRTIQKNIGKAQALLHFSPSGRLIKVVKEGTDRTSHNADDYQTLLLTLPENPVAIGETWKEEFKTRVAVDTKLSEQIALKRSYTLDKIEGTIAHITTSTYVLTPNRSPSIEVQLCQRKVRGTILFDMQRGALVSRDITATGDVPNAFGPKTNFLAKTSNVEKLVETPMFIPASAQK